MAQSKQARSTTTALEPKQPLIGWCKIAQDVGKRTKITALHSCIQAGLTTPDQINRNMTPIRAMPKVRT